MDQSGPATRPGRGSSRHGSTRPTAPSSPPCTARRTARRCPSAAIPQVLQDAVVAIEDQRFWHPPGRRPPGRGPGRGQQRRGGRGGRGRVHHHPAVREERVLGAERDVKRKLQEASLAYHLERKYSKERILELYLNTIYFGNGAYGVQAAAHEYFGKSAERPRPAQSALLAGIIRSPISLDPYDHPDLAPPGATGARQDGRARHAHPAPRPTRPTAPPRRRCATKPVDERYPAPHFVEGVKRFILDDPRFGDTPIERRRPALRRRAPIYTTVDLGCRPRPRRRWPRSCRRPRRTRRPRSSPSSRAPATCGPWSAAATSSAAATEAKLDLATQGTGRPAGLGVQAHRPRRRPRRRASRSPSFYGAPGRSPSPSRTSRCGRSTTTKATAAAGWTCRGHGPVVQHRLRPAGRRRRPGTGRPLAKAWASPRRWSRCSGRARHQRGAAHRHGVGVRDLRQPGRRRVARPSCPRSSGRRRHPYEHRHDREPGDRRGWSTTRSDVLQPGRPAGHGRPRAIGRPVGGQDRHRPAVAATPGSWVHARPGDGGVGRLPQGRDPDGAAHHPHPGSGGIVAGADLAAVHGRGPGQHADHRLPPAPSSLSGIDVTPRPVPNLVGMPACAGRAGAEPGRPVAAAPLGGRQRVPARLRRRPVPGRRDHGHGGSTVTLLVSAGAHRTAEVPDVLGRPHAEAVAAIKSAGFAVQLQTQPEGTRPRLPRMQAWSGSRAPAARGRRMPDPPSCSGPTPPRASGGGRPTARPPRAGRRVG